MRFHSWLASVVIVGIWCTRVSLGDGSSWKSGPPDGLPQLSKLSVDCGKEEMTIHLEFSAPYDGSVYSKSNGQSPRCIHVAPHSHVAEITFSISYHSCGTRSDSQGKYYENTIIIQYDDVVIEAWDEAKKIRCEWHDGYEKSAFKMPITISDLDVVEMNFQGDDVDCWLEVQDGRGPWSAKVEGLVPLGSPLTLVVAIQDSEGQFDMRVKSCIAHDGHKHPIHLTDEDGCVLRPKMMSPFQKTSDTKGTASVIAYSHFYAFKFPETVEVTIQCTVEICRHGCPDTCYQGRDAQTGSIENLPAQGKEPEIPTYKDSHPFSTVVTSKPGNHNHTSVLNASSSSTSLSSQSSNSSDDNEPLKASPGTHHDFYVNRFPFDLYDLLEAEEREDKGEAELFTDEDDYLEKNPIYFPPLTDVFGNIDEKAKTFEYNPSVQNISGAHESPNTSTRQSDLNNEFQDTKETEREENGSMTHSLEVGESFVDNARDEKPEDVVSSSEPNHMIEITTSTESTGIRDAFATKNQGHTLNQLFSAELFEGDVEKPASTESEFVGKANSGQISHSTDDFNSQALMERDSETYSKLQEKLHEYNTSLGDTGATEKPRDSKEVGLKDKSLNGQKRNLNNEETAAKTSSDEQYDYYEVKFRKPEDNNEQRHNIHNFNYRPFVPPAPLPPLTLYNGLPLHYYNQHNPKLGFFGRDEYEYSARHPYKKDYVKSKLRRPGTRRGRREIGEKEQLGLKHTLRVVATTDFDFLLKDNEKSKLPHDENYSTENDVCIAPSSFAAGLGLLLLANVCVLCVVVFLGHHYFMHRNKKVKNTELLSTEMT